MFDLRLRKYGDPILRKKARWIEKVGYEERDLLSYIRTSARGGGRPHKIYIKFSSR